MNWDSWLAEFYRLNSQDTVAFGRSRGAARRRLNRERENIEKALLAVKKAQEANPTATRAELQSAAYATLSGGFLLSFFLRFLLSALVRQAIEWFLDRVIETRETSRGNVSLSSK